MISIFKSSKTIISLIFLCLLTVAGCTHKNEIDFYQQEYIKQKAIGISLATYIGTENILVGNSSQTAKLFLLDAMKMNLQKEVIVEDIKVNSYSKDGNRILITIAIIEKPFKTILFHEMIFEKVDSKWIITDFGLDS